MRFLLIEDDEVDAELVRRSLKKAFPMCHVCETRYLEEAVAAAENASFDAVLADLSLPDSAGLMAVIQMVECCPQSPLVVLTGTDCQDISTKAIEIGAQDFLVKCEIEPGLLERSIRYAIQRHHLRSKNEQLLESLRKGEELLQAKNRKLEKVCKTAQEFVDNVSHEFRTPLTVIMEYASLLADSIAGPVNSEQEKLLGVIDDRASDLNNMVDDMLDVSKLESGLLDASRTRSDVQGIIDHVLPAIRRKALVRDVTLDVEVCSDLPAVYCDPEKVGRVIVNLAINAIKFSRNPGEVKILARRKGDLDVEVCVSDNGIGIPEDRQQEIFRRFSQVKTALSESTKGFGLGLNIAQELVELNFGKMGVESTEDVGSTFSFTLPIDEPREVTRRYLKRLTETAEDSAFVSAIRIAIAAGCSDIATMDAYRFLVHLLRQNDLLFPIDDREWLILVSAPEIALNDFFQRLSKQREMINRNRPRGPLLDFIIHTEDSLSAIDESEPLICLVENHFNMEHCLV